MKKTLEEQLATIKDLGLAKKVFAPVDNKQLFEMMNELEELLNG